MASRIRFSNSNAVSFFLVSFANSARRNMDGTLFAPEPCARGCQRRATPFLDERGLLLLATPLDADRELRFSRALPCELVRVGERESPLPSCELQRARGEEAW